MTAKLTIEFDNERAREHFAKWLCGAGEQDYWAWMEYRESEEPGPITAVRFGYHQDGKFSSELITTECSRQDDPSD
jgi:hypothetical protein